MRASPASSRAGSTVRARAWCRVDFGGGTLDIWPLGLLHPGARTVNAALDLPVTVQLHPRRRTFRIRHEEGLFETRTAADLATHPETALVGTVLAAVEAPPVEVRVQSASPRGGGLGASSALAVALIAAVEELRGKPRSPAREVVALARDLEARLMGLPTGVQDHYPALLGGVLEIVHGPGGHRVRRLAADLDGLGEALVVAYTGVGHFSAGHNWQVVRRRLDGDPEVVDLFAGIAAAAAEMPAAIVAGDLRRLGELMLREWGFRRHLAEGISTPVIESLLRKALAAGAWGGKACGAGGGGSIALVCPPGRRAAVAAELAAAGATVLDTRPIGARLRVGKGSFERS